MIEQINIRDLGVISDASLNFTRGLTCITGETGAGKTMVLTALSLLLGKRSDSGLIRHGATQTSVEGCWEVPSTSAALKLIEDVGGECEDGQLFINRTVHTDGKSKAVVGGKATPASSLNAIGEHLVAIHGQSDQIRLKSPVAQREALDRYAGKPLTAAMTIYTDIYTQWKHLTKEIDDIKNNQLARQREFEDLQVFVKDYEKVTPERNEDETLRIETEKLANLEGIQEAAAAAMQILSTEEYDGVDLSSLVGELVKHLESVSEFDPELAKMADDAENLKSSIIDLSGTLSTYLSNIDLEALNNLNQMHDRRAAINSLIRKYGNSLDEVIDNYEKSSNRMEELNPENSNLDTLKEKLAELESELKTAAKSVYDLRFSAAERLCEAVTAELAGLAMSGSSMVINVTFTENYSSTGADDIQFLLKHHGGGVAKPLGQGASGGELSRIMLSLELVLADPTTTPTFVFDEVDSGVGGSTAIEIGKRLASLAKTAQVIVVTHLPQVAAFADNHLRVLKTSGADFTSTDVTQLDMDEKLTEIARMLSGLNNSDTGTAHARELIDFAASFKNTDNIL
jgi:DNA repair protein RecN (Recombination protein N)